MKKIVLIGDSIRLGYDKFIRDSFSGIAEIYSPDENCRFAEYVLRYAHEWKGAGGWPSDVDVVHYNAGLWDALRLFGDEPLTPIETYGQLIARIDKRLRLIFPKAKIIFATNTAVQEEKYSGDFKRYNSEIREYNKVAVDSLKDTDTIINDLYAVTENLPEECHSDMTHFNTEAGVRAVGGKVLSVICSTLGINENDLDKTRAEIKKIDDKTLGF